MSMAWGMVLGRRGWLAAGVAAGALSSAGCPVMLPPEVSLEHRVRFVVPSFYRELVPA